VKKTSLFLGAGALLLLTACASVPTSPNVMVLPGNGKSFDQFRFDDHECRQFASAQLGGATADQAASDSVGKSAAAGAVIGGLAGAAITRSGHGAVAGAGLGGAGGAVAGAGAGSYGARTVQQRYDMGYQQCMYAKGHQIPMASRYERPSGHLSAPRTSAPPPPPPGTPPPPPPRG
jgi:hypothetical protein